jgi:hypothetical protein
MDKQVCRHYVEKHVSKLNQYAVNQKQNHLYYINFRQRSSRRTLFMLAIVLSVLDCFNVFMLQTYRFSLRYRDYDNFYLLFGCTVQ